MPTEYRTTSAGLGPDLPIASGFSRPPPDPIVPDSSDGGGSWQMVGAAATAEQVFWFWKRVTPEVLGKRDGRIIFERVQMAPDVTEERIRDLMRKVWAEMAGEA